MIALMFGGPNKAIPEPNNTRLINTALYEDLSVSVENQIKAAAFKAKPADVNIRLPYLSAILPLIGLKTKMTTSSGIRSKPAFNAL
jgi:hypothetical protein